MESFLLSLKVIKGLKSMLSIGLGHYLTLAAIIFIIGIVGIFLNRKNIIVILMSIELILLAVNINLVSFSAFLNDLTGQIFTLFTRVGYLHISGGETACNGHANVAPQLHSRPARSCPGDVRSPSKVYSF